MCDEHHQTTTVRDLIAALEKLDPEMHVLTDGYKGGFRDVNTHPAIEKYNRDIHDEWYYGAHEADEAGEYSCIVL